MHMENMEDDSQASEVELQTNNEEEVSEKDATVFPVSAAVVMEGDEPELAGTHRKDDDVESTTWVQF